MKEKLLLLFGMAWPVLVWAQSSVTLYGRLEESVNVQNFSAGAPASKDGTRTALASDTSVWGLRGSEDLGGGVKAYFKLENGFNATNGAFANSTLIWNREAYVGLSDPAFGSIDMGRHWAPGVFLTVRTDPFGRAQLGAQLTLLQGSAARGYSMSLPNSVKYTTPDFHGLSANFLATVPGGEPLSSNQAFEVDYSHGSLYIGMEYDNAAIAGSTVGLGALAATAAKTLAIGATYAFRPVKLFGYFEHNHVANLPDVSGYMLGAAVPIGFGEIRASVSHTGNPGKTALLMALGYDYSISVRTQVYAAVARLNNNGQANFGMWPASQVFGSSSPGQDITGFEIGMRHSF